MIIINSITTKLLEHVYSRLMGFSFKVPALEYNLQTCQSSYHPDDTLITTTDLFLITESSVDKSGVRLQFQQSYVCYGIVLCHLFPGSFLSSAHLVRVSWFMHGCME